MEKEMKLMSWNVNGIRSVAKKGFTRYLFNQAPDILCLQETKAQPEQLEDDIISPPGYQTIWNYPSEKKGYSGVAVFTREKPLKTRLGIGIKEFDEEGRVIVAEYPWFTLFNVYFPKGDTNPSRIHRLDYKMAFYNSFLEFVDTYKSREKRLVICGDFNTAHQPVDLARPKENQKTSGFLPQERAWIDKLIEHGFEDTFRKFNPESNQYSWWDVKTRAKERGIGWRLDYFFISNALSESIIDAFILDNVKQVIGSDASDHCPVGIKLKIPGK
jgi:exodeoxyribonuclease III